MKMPDTRGFVVIGLFILSAAIFGMIGFNPAITSNQGFEFLAQAVIVSGLISGPVTYLFGASKKDTPDPNATTTATTTTTIVPQPEPPTQ